MFRNLVQVKFLSICMSRARNNFPLIGDAVLFSYSKSRIVAFVLTKQQNTFWCLSFRLWYHDKQRKSYRPSPEAEP
jgi:hypothetical protein